MNVKDKMIIEDYRKSRDSYIKLDNIVYEKLCAIVKETGINTFSIEHRLKSETSLAGKLVRSGEWYQKLSDLTDIIGARVICFFNDEVDKLGRAIEENFSVDRDSSSDKRALIKSRFIRISVASLYLLFFERIELSRRDLQQKV